MDTNLSFYELLGVKNDATEDEIKQAYKKQMKKWHPDINKDPNAVNISSRINEAKEVLLDPVKRYDYDEYLKKKVNETYNRYTQKKNKEEYSANEKEKNYEDKKVTKWQYLKEWLKYAQVAKFRKVIGVTGVLLESLLCFIIKCLIIVIAYVTTIGSIMIREIYRYLSPILGILAVLVIGTIFTNGFDKAISDNKNIMMPAIIAILVYIASLILPLLSKLLLSAKTFDILYNKIDINLFKASVGYKN